jgi:hypothetical protein
MNNMMIYIIFVISLSLSTPNKLPMIAHVVCFLYRNQYNCQMERNCHYNREQPQQISTPVPYPFLLKATLITKLAFH